MDPTLLEPGSLVLHRVDDSDLGDSPMWPAPFAFQHRSSQGIGVVLGHRTALLADDQGIVHAIHVLFEAGRVIVIHDVNNLTAV